MFYTWQSWMKLRNQTYILKMPLILYRLSDTFFSFLGDKSSVRMTEVVTRVRELAFYSAKHCNSQMLSQRTACSFQISQDTFFTSICSCSTSEVELSFQICVFPDPLQYFYAAQKMVMKSRRWILTCVKWRAFPVFWFFASVCTLSSRLPLHV